jgi:hypothetical protein
MSLRLVFSSFLILVSSFLASCSNDIAGFSRNERLTLYATAATLTGHPELAAAAQALRLPTTSAKQPQRILP